MDAARNKARMAHIPELKAAGPLRAAGKAVGTVARAASHSPGASRARMRKQTAQRTAATAAAAKAAAGFKPDNATAKWKPEKNKSPKVRKSSVTVSKPAASAASSPAKKQSFMTGGEAKTTAGVALGTAVAAYGAHRAYKAYKRNKQQSEAIERSRAQHQLAQ